MSNLKSGDVGVVCTTTNGTRSYTGILSGPDHTLYCIDNVPYVPAPTLKQNMATNSPKVSLLGMMLCIMGLLGNALADTLYAADFGQLQPSTKLYKRSSGPPLVNALADSGVSTINNNNLTVLDTSEGGDKFYDTSNNVLIEVISNEEIAPVNNTNVRRGCPSAQVTFWQYQVAQHGYWWSSWTQAVSTIDCNQGGEVQ